MDDGPINFRTFLFTDIENSTSMWERDPDTMSQSLVRHDDLLYSSIEEAGGAVFKHLGDGVVASFHDANDALRAAVAAQKALDGEAWPPTTPIRVRVGLHYGVAERRRGDYFGRAVNCAARIMSAAAGGQIVLSRAVADQLSAADPVEFRNEGFCELRGIAQPVELLTVLAQGLPRGFAALATPPSSRSTIPLSLSDIVGREVELETIDRMLDAHRLLTLTGPPGTGKTRLAVEAAVRATARFSDGVHLVEIGSIVEGPGVGDAVAEVVLGIDPIARSGTAIERLSGSLAAKTVLVVLDNCEHLAAEVRVFARALLSRVPGLKVLATSREPIAMFGEHVMIIHPLSTVGTAGTSPAEQLFLQRARAARSDIRNIDLDVVADICERLDGLPLALELAAARLNVLSIDELSAKLFAVLSAGRRTAANERHSTLDSAIDWSWQLLDRDERQVLIRASSFSGSFDLDAASAVCGSDDYDAIDVIDLIASLSDRSFLSTVYSETGNRFRLLDVIRTFVAGQGAPDEIEAAHNRHQQYFLRVTAPLSEQFDLKPDQGLIARLELDDDNFAAAMRDRPGSSVQNARKLAMQLHTYWEETGRLNDGFEYTQRLLEPRDEGSRLWRAVLGLSVSYAAMTGHLTDVAEGEAILEELAGARPDVGALNAYFALGFVSLGRAELVEAARWFDVAAEVVAPFDGGAQRQALMTAGACFAYNDDPTRALTYYEQARNVPPPEQGWFDAYATVFECAARLQADPTMLVDERLSAIDRSLSALADLGLGFRVTVAVHQSAVAFELTDALDLLGHWWPVGLRLARNNGHRWAAALAIEIAGWASARSGDEAGALRHWAVADGAFAESGYALPTVHRRLSERRRSEVRRRIGDDRFNELYRSILGTDLAVHLARL